MIFFIEIFTSELVSVNHLFERSTHIAHVGVFSCSHFYRKKIDWAKLVARFKYLTSAEFLSNLGLVGAGVTGATVASMLPVGDIPGAATAKGFAIKGSIAAALIGAVNIAWPKLEDYIYSEVRGMSPDEIAKLDGKI